MSQAELSEPPPNVPDMAGTAVIGQVSIDQAGTPLSTVTFVVVDLETTGGSPTTDSVTEIGALKVKGGEVLGQFQTLVNPGASIPAFVTVLTGITDTMVVAAPPLAAVLPQFLEWASGAVLVAHNAPFDVGFLRAGAARLGLDWPGFAVLDTARLARAALGRDEAPDCRLATLARLYCPQTPPTHRALDDARATVAVLHGLFERLGSLGVHTLEEARSFSALVTPAQRRKRTLADGLPQGPGVYLFRDRSGRVLYAGKSRHLATRVRQYFVASDRRTRMREMVGLAQSVDALACETELEAAARELRLIAEHAPPYNRRSRFPERGCYLTLTKEAYPRMSIVRRPPGPGSSWIGPFGSRRTAELAMEAVHEAFPLRRCTRRMGRHGGGRACALAGLGRCPAPCEAAVSVADYGRLATAARDCLQGDAEPVVRASRQRLAQLAQQQRFEEAALVRDRLAGFLRGIIRAEQVRGLVAAQRLLAARPAGGGFELALIESGRLLATAAVRPGESPRERIEALIATAPCPPQPDQACPPGAGAGIEEIELVGRWLATAGTRLVALTGVYASRLRGPSRWSPLLHELAPVALTHLDDQRQLRPAR